MAIIFQDKPGHVVRLSGDSALQCTLRTLNMLQPPRGAPLTFDSQRCIVTRLTIDAQVNAQFLHTLGGQIFIYVFGDRVGGMTLSGLAFACACPDDGLLGAEQTYLWWLQNRASQRRVPIRILLGTTAIDGCLIRFTADVVDPSIDLVQWNAQLVTFPDDTPDVTVGVSSSSSTSTPTPTGSPSGSIPSTSPIEWPGFLPVVGPEFPKFDPTLFPIPAPDTFQDPGSTVPAIQTSPSPLVD